MTTFFDSRFISYNLQFMLSDAETTIGLDLMSKYFLNSRNQQSIRFNSDKMTEYLLESSAKARTSLRVNWEFLEKV